MKHEEVSLRDLGQHLGELVLDELERRDRLAELDARQRVVARRLEAAHRRAERAPGDAEARLREAIERRLQALGLRQDVRLRDPHVLQDELGRDRRAQRPLAVLQRRGEARRALLDQEPADDAVELRPDDGDVGDAAVRDPHLRAVEHVVIALVLGAS